MVETLEYSVLKKDDNIEIREYGHYILAQVDIDESFDDAINKGFSILANYIFGGNKKSLKLAMTAPVSEEQLNSEKIAMTTPVTEEEVTASEKIAMTTPVTEEKTGRNFHRISFSMPSKYKLETLPEPEDEKIHFKEFKDQKIVALRFKGRVKEKLAKRKIEELKEWLSNNNFEPKSHFIVAQYNNPLVPGLLRRNEILVEI
ncbi:MAG: heme-binding protein [Methanobacterium sp.]|uniref:SOUL family heme-binding protein n=1 Tax=Methanobacterium sp. TaxID=2164 RepID=UPI003D64C3F5|nr:heme-binding protein [Methanobacterium sp.]